MSGITWPMALVLAVGILVLGPVAVLLVMWIVGGVGVAIAFVVVSILDWRAGRKRRAA